MIMSPSAPFAGRMKVKVSKELYLSGCLGPTKLISKNKSIPDAEELIGESGGEDFYINAPFNTSTFLFFFSHRNADLNIKSKPCFF